MWTILGECSRQRESLVLSLVGLEEPLEFEEIPLTWISWREGRAL